jgi:hypothetical protein
MRTLLCGIRTSGALAGLLLAHATGAAATDSIAIPTGHRQSVQPPRPARVLWEGTMGDRPYPTTRSGLDLRHNRKKLPAPAPSDHSRQMDEHAGE